MSNHTVYSTLLTELKNKSIVKCFLPVRTSPPVIVNDTLTGDPLMTVPILTDPNVKEGDPIISLCYEVHGEADKFFNLVSDSCVTVNAHYSKAPIPGPGVDLNVVDAIGVRAVSNTGDCVNIRVGLQGCNTTVNGAVISMYRSNGITVRKYSNRVRMSVPNCGDTDLVMWAFCTSGRTEDSNLNYHDFDFIRFVVMRGLNLAEESHGIMGEIPLVHIECCKVALYKNIIHKIHSVLIIFKNFSHKFSCYIMEHQSLFCLLGY